MPRRRYREPPVIQKSHQRRISDPYPQFIIVGSRSSQMTAASSLAPSRFNRFSTTHLPVYHLFVGTGHVLSMVLSISVFFPIHPPPQTKKAHRISMGFHFLLQIKRKAYSALSSSPDSFSSSASLAAASALAFFCDSSITPPIVFAAASSEPSVSVCGLYFLPPASLL